MLTFGFSPIWGGGESVSAPLPPITFSGDPEAVMCAPVWSDDLAPGDWYGGAWRDTLPVSRLATDELEDVARSVDLALESTQARRSLGKVRAVSAVSIARATCTVNARFRVTLGLSDDELDSDTPLYRSAWLPTWPVGYDPEDARAFSVPHFMLLDAPVNASFVKVEWDDTGNANGYLDISRAQVAAALVFENGMSVGAEVVIHDDSDVVQTDGNTTKKFKRPKWRSLVFTIDMQSELSAFLQSFQLQASVGITDQFFLIFDRNDDDRMKPRRSWIGRLKATAGVKWSSSMYLATSLEHEEDL